MKRRVVVATGNRGKLRELQETLAGLDWELVPQSELGVQPTPEPAVTFVENALVKARHAARETGLPAIADDSGLVVPVLGGAPGVRSARYAGEPQDDAANNAKLVAKLDWIRERGAFFYCVLVSIQKPDDPTPLVATGHWSGWIIDHPRGDSGFGYDPHFLIPRLGKTAAELPAAEKNRHSHRGKASRALAAMLER